MASAKWEVHSAAPSSSTSSSTSSTTSRSVEKLKFIVLGGANAGKTSILRQYFHGCFDPARRPTVGSDFYTKKIPPSVKTSPSSTTTQGKKSSQSGHSNGSHQEEQRHLQHVRASLSVQVWDTPGRERFAANQTKPLYTAAFSDSFFKSADAAILVYDITSSTSFTHVLKWFKDLMTRIRRLELSGERTRPFPVVIVGNKIDIMHQRDTHPSRRQAVVAQRDVLGMTNKAFRGKDLHYEYTACATHSSENSMSAASGVPGNNSNKKRGTNDRHRFELSTYMGTGEKTNYLQAVLNNDVQIGSYLESLLSTEDGSHPDKDMVILWCMRNGLKHMEVSALDGTGIDDMINEVIDMVLEARVSTTTKKNNRNDKQSKEILNPESATLTTLLQRNDELDLKLRYAPKPQSCFNLFPFQLCCKPTSLEERKR